MRIGVVSDIHGNFAALEQAAAACDRLIILGDLLDYVDYHDPSAGILGHVFGADRVRRFTQLRLMGAFVELRRYNQSLWQSIADPVGTLTELVQDRYRQVVNAVPEDTVVTLGNVDVADLWNAVAPPPLHYRDGVTVSIDGLEFAFVAGGARRTTVPLGMTAPAPGTSAPASPWRPFMRDGSEYLAVVQGLPDADVLCSHIPPALHLLSYDRVPARNEMTGPGLLDYIDRVQPALALFGHVHQPIASRARRGLTECVNAGHFQRTASPLVIDTDLIRASREAAARARSGLPR